MSIFLHMTKRDKYLTRDQVLELTGWSHVTLAKRQRAGLIHPLRSKQDMRRKLYVAEEVQAILDPATA